MYPRITQLVVFMLCFCSLNTVIAQSLKNVLERDTLIHYYRLNGAQLLEIYRSNKIKDTAWFTNDLYKSYHYLTQKSEDSIEYGSYLKTYVYKNQVTYKFVQLLPFSFTFKKLDNEILLYLKSKDAHRENELISDASISLLDRKIAYDSSFGAYVIPKELLTSKESQKFLQIFYAGRFYIQRFHYTPEPMLYDNNRYRNSSDKLFGYCLSDKPMYKHGDSLRFKAYLYEPKSGEPMTRDVYLKVYDHYHSRDVMMVKISPTTPGAYLFDWQIPDSLLQDQDYTIMIGYANSNSRFIGRQHKFRVESYLLDKSNIQLTPSKPEFKAGEKLDLNVTTTDANGFPIGGVRLQYVVKIVDVEKSRQDTLVISQRMMDSLIVVDTILPYDKIHLLQIDDSKLPNADMRLSIEGSLTDPQYEQKNFSYNLFYKAETDHLSFLQQEDTLHVVNEHLCKVVSKNYKLKMYNDKLDYIDSSYITTPLHFKLNPSIYKVALFDSSKLVRQINIIYNKLEMLHVKGSRNPRDVQISFKFPFQNVVYYRVKRKDMIVQKGYGDNVKFTATDSSLDEYSILLSHNFGGEIEKTTYRFCFYPLEKKVKIHTSLPEKAFPGQTLPIDFQVTDWYGKPVSGLNLASYAVNIQFKEKISEPYIDIPARYKMAMHTETLEGTYSQIRLENLSFENSYPIIPRHIDKFNLYKNEFYQMLYPKKGYFEIRNSKHHSYPELTVTVSYKGSLYFPKYILLDQQYIAVSNISKPEKFSFLAKEGFHSLHIRTFDKLITIPKIELKNFYKHVFAINLDSIESGFYRSELFVIDSLPLMTTTSAEQKSLEKAFIYFSRFTVDSVMRIANDPMLEKMHNYYYNDFPQIRIDREQINVLGPFAYHNIVMINKNREYNLQTGRYLHYFTQVDNRITALSASKEMDAKTQIDFGLRDYLIHNFPYLQYQVERDSHVQTNTSPSEYHEEDYIKTDANNFDPTAFNFNETKTTNNIFSIHLHSKDNNETYAIWIVNRKDKYSSQFINFSSRTSNYNSYNANAPVDIYLISPYNKLYVYRNVVIPDHHTLYINMEMLKWDTLKELDLKDVIAMYNQLTEIPKLPFYYHPIESHKIPLENKSILNSSGKATLTGRIHDEQVNAIADAHILLEQNGVYKYGAITNNYGEFEFLSIPAGMYDIKIIHSDYVLKFFYHAKLGGKFHQELVVSLEDKETQKPIFESVANSHRLSIFDSYGRSSAGVKIYDRETRSLLNNSQLQFIYDGDTTIIKAPHKNVVKYAQLADSVELVVSCPGFKSMSFHLSSMEIENKLALDVFLDKNTSQKPTVDNFYFNTELYNEFEVSKVEPLTADMQYGEVRGHITDDKGEPVPFANIVVIRDIVGKERTSKGTKADANGLYVLRGLTPGVYNLMAISVGKPRSIELGVRVRAQRATRLDFVFEEKSNIKKEVMIRASSKPKPPKMIDVYKPKENVIGAHEVKEAALRKYNSVTTTTSGIVQDDVGASLDVSGGRGSGLVYFVDGVKMTGSPSVPPAQLNQIEVYTSGVPAKYGDMEEISESLKSGMTNKIRENFSDLGYWIPNLVTDKQGRASASITLPDNITQWQSYTLGMGSQYQYGLTSQMLSVYKPLQTITYAPTYLHEGDSLWIKAKFTNLTNSSKTVKTFFDLQNIRQKENMVSIMDYSADSLQLVAIEDTITFTAGLTYENKYRDAERLKIPVLSNDIKLYQSQAVYADQDSTYWIYFSENTRGTIHFNNSMYENILYYIDDLNNYSYGCVEQTASKLKALTYKQTILTKLNKPIQIQKEMNQMAKRLDKMQNKNGSFGWWRAGDGDLQMTTYALDALMTYARGSYNSAASEAANFIKKQFKSELTASQLYSAYILAKYNMIAIDRIRLSEIDVLKLNTSEKIYYYKLKQMKGESIAANDWYQLILELEGNLVTNRYDNFFNDPKANVFNAYTIFQGSTIESELKSKFKNDILSGQLAQGLNTFSKAAMIQNLLSSDYLETNVNAEVVINDQIRVNQFPYHMKLDNISKLKLAHKGAPLWMTSSEEIFVTNPPIRDSVFKIETQFIQNNTATQSLVRGHNTQLKVHVFAYQSKDYVMIEIPLPAGVIVKDKKSYHGKDYVEYHMDKIVLFKTKIPLGEHILTFDIQPIYSGSFHIPPAHISMMYYPHIYGNNTARKIVVR